MDNVQILLLISVSINTIFILAIRRRLRDVDDILVLASDNDLLLAETLAKSSKYAEAIEAMQKKINMILATRLLELEQAINDK